MIPKLNKDQFKQVYDKGLDATFVLFDALQNAVETLEKRVAHLEAILAKDSHNSSKPPSSNGFVPLKACVANPVKKPEDKRGITVPR
jgi:hypothetical protein